MSLARMSRVSALRLQRAVGFPIVSSAIQNGIAAKNTWRPRGNLPTVSSGSWRNTNSTASATVCCEKHTQPSPVEQRNCKHWPLSPILPCNQIPMLKLLDHPTLLSSPAISPPSLNDIPDDSMIGSSCTSRLNHTISFDWADTPSDLEHDQAGSRSGEERGDLAPRTGATGKHPERQVTYGPRRRASCSSAWSMEANDGYVTCRLMPHYRASCDQRTEPQSDVDLANEHSEAEGQGISTSSYPQHWASQTSHENMDMLPPSVTKLSFLSQDAHSLFRTCQWLRTCYQIWDSAGQHSLEPNSYRQPRQEFIRPKPDVVDRFHIPMVTAGLHQCNFKINEGSMRDKISDSVFQKFKRRSNS